MLQLPVYLDYNATTPCDPAVVEAMLPYFTEHFGNAASRSHAYGWQAEEAVVLAREQVAQLIHAEPSEIIFTSGATEADNLALRGVADMYAAKGARIITTAIEHKAVLDTCKQLERTGVDITYLPVNKEGLIDLNDLEKAIKPSTILIAVMYANNETGVIQPIRDIGAIARKHNVLFFTDATQAVGKTPVDVNADNIDILALSAHKLYGPKGVGAIYVRRKNPRVKLTPQIAGGGHEKGMRSGTLNVPGIVGLGKASAMCQQHMGTEAAYISSLRNKLEKALSQLPATSVNGSRVYRLPNTTNMAFAYADSNGLMMAVGKQIAVSSGSACTSASLEPSYVLRAMGLPDELAHSSLRFSLGRFTTEEEIDYAVEQVSAAVQHLRELNPLWDIHIGKVKTGSVD